MCSPIRKKSSSLDLPTRSNLLGRAIVFFALAINLSATRASAQLEPQPTQFENEEVEEQPQEVVLTRAPELLEGAEPVYPEDAKAEGRQGEVIMLITIEDDGVVSRVEISQSAGEDLDFAAMGAAAQFIFRAAEFNGVPSAVAIEYLQVFEIEEVVEEVATEEAAEIELESAAFAKGEEGPLNFQGVIREAGSKAPLELVEVSVEVEQPLPEDAPADAETPYELITTFSDEEGRFAFRGIPTGRHRVSFAFTGYEPSFIIEDFSQEEITQSIVYLRLSQANQFETVIREKRAQKEVAKVSLSREEVRRIPGTFGDPLRVVENLPGLARAPFIGGALIVRGASPDDTGVYFDGVEIPVLYHFGGLKSVVNAEFLEDIAFYPGGFGAYYGRASAGIVDVKSRDLEMKSFRGFAEVSVIDTSFFFGGPIKIGNLPTVTVAAAARRSYIDALIPLALDIFVPENGSGIVASPVYWDYQFKAQVKPTSAQKLSFFMFGSDDDLRVVSSSGEGDGFDLGLKTTFHRAVGRWTWRLPGNLIHMTQPYVGLIDFGVGTDSDIGINFSIGSQAMSWGLRDELRWSPSEIFETAIGLDYLGDSFTYDLDFPIPLEIGSFPRVFPRLTGDNIRLQGNGVVHRFGTYTEGVFSPFPFFRIVPGLRFESISVFYGKGADITNDYGNPTDPNFQSDLETNFEDRTADTWSIDPRITARLDVLTGTTLKGAVGIYRQQLNTDAANPDFGNPDLVAERAWQLIGGVEQSLTRNINLDMQLYYTWRDHQVQNTDEIIPKGDGEFDLVGSTNSGFGRTYGVEFLLRHEITEYFFGWIAYTLSRSDQDLDEDQEKFILTEYDQTHILTIVGQFILPWEFTVGGRFRLVSGNPTTIPVGSVHDLDTTNYNALRQPQRATRLPAFHQLDVRIDRKFVFDNFSFTPFLDLLNVYNQENAESYTDDYRYNQRQAIPSLPILPNFGLQGEF
jgi:TonB family protein